MRPSAKSLRHPATGRLLSGAFFDLRVSLITPVRD